MNIKTIRTIINRFEEIVVVFLLSIMAVVLGMQVFCRFVLSMPLSWSEEMSRYLLIWITFIGAGYGVKHHYHIEMEALFKLFPKALQKLVQTFTNVICMAAYGYIIPDAIRFVSNQSHIESSAMGVPMNLVFICIPIGCAILVVRLVIDTVNMFRGVEVKGEGVFIE